MTADIPLHRIRLRGNAVPRGDGSYVLYWMVAARRTQWNFAFDHAVNWATRLGLPLVVFEPLRCDYPWASDRFHAFVMQGMRDNAAALAGSPITYIPYVEPAPGASKALFAALVESAALVVTDDSPAFFFAKMLDKMAVDARQRIDAVDGNGIYPLRATDRVFTTAASFRRHLQKDLGPYLGERPRTSPWLGARLARLKELPAKVARLLGPRSRGPVPKQAQTAAWLLSLPLDHQVSPVPDQGGSAAADALLEDFVENLLIRYPNERNQPEAAVQSHLSAYLHFGHISAHKIFCRVMEHVNWSPALLHPKATGSRSGWWGAGEAAEAFLDQLITWRELGWNRAAHDPDYTEYDSLPAWARASLAHHARDPRPYLYGPEEFESALTHDPLWNAAQRQLVREGTIHNYLRMLWGKKILEWSPTPQLALATMVHLNNKYALDGRDPNSYSGIFWVLGRYDRAWGPEREVYGKVRYMSSENTARKVNVKPYLARYGPTASLPGM